MLGSSCPFSAPPTFAALFLLSAAATLFLGAREGSETSCPGIFGFSGIFNWKSEKCINYCGLVMEPGAVTPSESAWDVDTETVVHLHDLESCHTVLVQDVANSTQESTCAADCSRLLGSAAFVPPCWINQFPHMCFKARVGDSFSAFPVWAPQVVGLVYLVISVVVSWLSYTRTEQPEELQIPAGGWPWQQIAPFSTPLCCLSDGERNVARFSIIKMGLTAVADRFSDAASLVTYLQRGQPFFFAISLASILACGDVMQRLFLQAIWRSYQRGWVPTHSVCKHLAAEVALEGSIGFLLPATTLFMQGNTDFQVLTLGFSMLLSLHSIGESIGGGRELAGHMLRSPQMPFGPQLQKRKQGFPLLRMAEIMALVPACALVASNRTITMYSIGIAASLTASLGTYLWGFEVFSVLNPHRSSSAKLFLSSLSCALLWPLSLLFPGSLGSPIADCAQRGPYWQLLLPALPPRVHYSTRAVMSCAWFATLLLLTDAKQELFLDSLAAVVSAPLHFEDRILGSYAKLGLLLLGFSSIPILLPSIFQLLPLDPTKMSPSAKMVLTRLKVAESQEGGNSLEIANSRSNLGRVLLELSENKGALEQLELSLKYRLQLSSKSSPELAATLTDAGKTLLNLGKFPEAQEKLESAKRMHEELGQSISLEAASTLNTLGVVLARQKKYEEGKQHVEEGLKIRDRRGNSLADVESQLPLAESLNDLALIRESINRTRKDTQEEEAITELKKRALQIWETVLEDDDLQVAYGRMVFAKSLLAVGQKERAKELQEGALRIREAMLGPAHQKVAVTLSNLAATLQALGEHRRALELLQRCIDIYEEDVGPEHDYVRKALIQMSASLTAVGEVQRAADVNARIKTIGNQP